MMWMPYALDANRYAGKQLIITSRSLKWVKMNSALPRGSSKWFPMVDGMINITFTIMVIIK
jgi:hypothetical protein